MRLILDTNLWISFLITSRYDKLDDILLKKDCQLIFSKELLDEFIDVAHRPKLQKYVSEDELVELLDVLDDVGVFIEVTTVATMCRDPKDNFLLALALDGEADYLLTGDKDLLVLEHVGNTKIMKMSNFFEEIKTS